MAKLSRETLFKARQDKAARLREEWEKISQALDDAHASGDTDAISAALAKYDEYQAQRAAEEDAKNAKQQAKLEIRKARAEGQLAVGKKKLVWTEGGRDLVTGTIKKTPKFQVAAEGNLAKSNRDIGKWETAFPYDNVRGVSKGEILMIISENYEDHNGKQVVDVMVGPDIVKGIPAYALRPLE